MTKISSSAYDVAIVARNPHQKNTHKSWKSRKTFFYFAGMTITSTNYMLEGMPAYRGGFDGLKTGTTDKAGESLLVLLSKRDEGHHSCFECRSSRQ